MVEPGNEYYVHMSLWKNVPLTFKMDGNTEFMDVTLRKVVESRDTGNCNSNKDYKYTGNWYFVRYIRTLK